MMKQRQKSKSDGNYKKFDKHSDSDDEETELFTIKNSSPRKEKATVEKVVEEGDTLQSLAIRYCCTIEDLKRLNNIHKENEVFAKRTIRVPHHPISMALAGVHVSGRSSPNHSMTSVKMDTAKLTTSLQESEVNQIIFNSNIAQKSQPIEQTDESQLEDEDEEVYLLPPNAVTDPSGSRLNWSGVDGDISLKALILCIIVIIFAVPLIYVFYLAEHPETYHHNHVS